MPPTASCSRAAAQRQIQVPVWLRVLAFCANTWLLVQSDESAKAHAGVGSILASERDIDRYRTTRTVVPPPKFCPTFGADAILNLLPAPESNVPALKSKAPRYPPARALNQHAPPTSSCPLSPLAPYRRTSTITTRPTTSYAPYHHLPSTTTCHLPPRAPYHHVPPTTMCLPPPPPQVPTCTSSCPMLPCPYVRLSSCSCCSSLSYAFERPD